MSMQAFSEAEDIEDKRECERESSSTRASKSSQREREQLRACLGRRSNGWCFGRGHGCTWQRRRC